MYWTLSYSDQFIDTINNSGEYAEHRVNDRARKMRNDDNATSKSAVRIHGVRYSKIEWVELSRVEYSRV